MSLRLLPMLAWLLLAAVAFVTLAPIGLRPMSMFSPNVERFVSFGVVGLAFALAYPRHLWVILAVVLGSAVVFELLQLAVQSRHGRLLDVAVKLAGGGLGIAAGAVADRIWRRRTA
ncbi:MAG: hypothetical protein JWQ89_3516 [Devosia sp.]|uniref:hypothetical protein n=1 Tax=Devosia sp. TaxID=1871048 RepID=UPI002627BE92|nr:hypothetical protein [Devosia sp.]MDB5541789.1 hypothetical protein [Devosia sp.]